MSYPEALAWLYGLQRFGIKLGLENIRRLIADLHVDLSRTRMIHVAGTNGKGSVCAMIDAIARAGGYRTGLFISPHLVTFRERIRIDGEMISEQTIASGLSAIRNLAASWDPHPTFFEITTALALKYFRRPRSTSSFWRQAWADASTPPTPFNPMSLSSHRSISIIKSGWATRWKKSQTKKRESLSEEFLSSLPRSVRKLKK